MDRRITGLPPTTTAPNWDSRLNLPSSTGDSPEFPQASTDTQWFFANQSFGCFCLLKTDQWHLSPTFPNKIPSLLVGVKILQAKLLSDSARGLLILTVMWTDSLWSKIYDGTSNDLVIPSRPKKVFYYEEDPSHEKPFATTTHPYQPIWLEKTETKGPNFVLQRGSFFILRRCGDLRLLWYCRGLSRYRSLTLQGVNEKSPKWQWGLGPPKGSHL